MTLNYLAFTIISSVSISVSSASSANNLTSGSEPAPSIERITINHIISPNHYNIAGAIVALDSAEIEQQRPFSIKEALENIAGINVVGEDVFSTHLNIGMRGLNPRRSARTLLMEDGMPLYLAPFGPLFAANRTS
ncbi:TonB-dependent receptor plug domain-containing protein [Pseudoalteromonas ulvae]|uniref:TonB-dependent receptor plug domain-containing protein n=1 Tax=Pseudoalteromonas ulvae TaxID=107327 RepID=A0A244CLE0_PSEDV|nr:TonB-dependent receptor plug domain-containing protein [Pseudoalteromonas ulvae]OUL56346.1 hypothetical protein B1199_16855 [Pseudoalteromonas ulvae]